MKFRRTLGPFLRSHIFYDLNIPPGPNSIRLHQPLQNRELRLACNFTTDLTAESYFIF